MENEKFFYNICEDCVKLLISFYTFREDCFRAHIKFGEVYQSKNYIHDKKESLHSIKLNENTKLSNSSNVFEDVKPTVNDISIVNKDFTEFNDEVKGSVNDDMESIPEQDKFDDHSISENSEINYKKETLKFSCTQCKKVFQSKYGLSEHVKIHLCIEKAKCDICGKLFTRYQNYLKILNIFLFRFRCDFVFCYFEPLFIVNDKNQNTC